MEIQVLLEEGDLSKARYPLMDLTLFPINQEKGRL